jgi:hypothetical protein
MSDGIGVAPSLWGLLYHLSGTVRPDAFARLTRAQLHVGPNSAHPTVPLLLIYATPVLAANPVVTDLQTTSDAQGRLNNLASAITATYVFNYTVDDGTWEARYPDSNELPITTPPQ